jgi:hypothetical protein
MLLTEMEKIEEQKILKEINQRYRFRGSKCLVLSIHSRRNEGLLEWLKWQESLSSKHESLSSSTSAIKNKEKMETVNTTFM